MERQINTTSILFKDCVRIAFILPKNGNDVEYMAFRKGQHGFTGLVRAGELMALEHEEELREKSEAKQKEKDHAEYLRLKEIFEPN